MKHHTSREISAVSTHFVDLNLARRLEEAEAFAAEAFARALAQSRPDSDVAVEEVAGGRAVYFGPGSPLSETKGAGLNGPVTDADLDRMEATFFARREDSRIVACPLADPSLVDGLGRRGYRLIGFEDILILPLESDRPVPAETPGIAVREVGRESAEIYAGVVAPSFVPSGEPTAEIAAMMKLLFAVEHAAAMVAWIGDQPVGGGAVLIRDGVALLAGAATLPAFRNRGVHSALHAARLELARRSGCDLAAQGALPGTTSHRNAERRGFRVAYTRAMLVRAFH